MRYWKSSERLGSNSTSPEIKVLLHAITVKSKEKLIERMCEPQRLLIHSQTAQRNWISVCWGNSRDVEQLQILNFATENTFLLQFAIKQNSNWIYQCLATSQNC